MKKLIFIFCAFGLILNSCSDSESDTINNPPTDSVFLKSIIETYEGEELVTNFTYSDNKLIEVSDSDGYREVFIYTDDLLTTVEEYEDDVLDFQTELEYDSNNRLIKETYTFGSSSMQVNEYSYNANGSVVTMVEGGGDTYIYTFNPFGNRLAEEHVEGDEDYSYTYDTMNNPFRNIHQRYVFGLLGRDTYFNNILSYINTSSAAFSDDFTSSYFYNASDYPTSGSTTYNQGSVDQEVVTMEFIYEL